MVGRCTLMLRTRPAPAVKGLFFASIDIYPVPCTILTHVGRCSRHHNRPSRPCTGKYRVFFYFGRSFSYPLLCALALIYQVKCAATPKIAPSLFRIKGRVLKPALCPFIAHGYRFRCPLKLHQKVPVSSFSSETMAFALIS